MHFHKIFHAWLRRPTSRWYFAKNVFSWHLNMVRLHKYVSSAFAAYIIFHMRFYFAKLLMLDHSTSPRSCYSLIFIFVFSFLLDFFAYFIVVLIVLLFQQINELSYVICLLWIFYLFFYRYLCLVRSYPVQSCRVGYVIIMPIGRQVDTVLEFCDVVLYPVLSFPLYRILRLSCPVLSCSIYLILTCLYIPGASWWGIVRGWTRC